MVKKTETAKDQTAFQEAVKGVTKLVHTKIVPTQPKPKPQRRPPLEEETFEEEMHCLFSDFDKLELVSCEDILQFSRPGIQDKILRKLRSGQYTMEAKLDLHGKTIEEAKQALAQFLLYCQRQKVRHALIIHGKGRRQHKPILKNKLNHWLRQTDQVLAFSSAIARDGSTGAVYVLLRK